LRSSPSSKEKQRQYLSKTIFRQHGHELLSLIVCSSFSVVWPYEAAFNDVFRFEVSPVVLVAGSVSSHGSVSF
jgi:hypothetical protein